jgi:hypothetical protein
MKLSLTVPALALSGGIGIRLLRLRRRLSWETSRDNQGERD